MKKSLTSLPILLTIILLTVGLSGCTPAPTPTVTMPDVVGETADVAHAELSALGLTWTHSEMVIIASNWIVTTTTPAAGSKVVIGAEVLLSVSKPVTEETIPDVTDIPSEVKTIGGITASDGFVWCEQYGQKIFPYGYTLHYYIGRLAETYDAATDTWYLKAESTVTNEYGTEQQTNTECYITGSNENPQIVDFLTY